MIHTFINILSYGCLSFALSRTGTNFTDVSFWIILGIVLFIDVHSWIQGISIFREKD
jgi:hypothetical protein